MSTDRRIRIDLTPEQQHQVRVASGKEIATIELAINELEQRIAPTSPVFEIKGFGFEPS